jgi:uncharacterized protein
MNCIKAGIHVARLAAVVLALVAAPAAFAQPKPSPAAMAAAKELIAVTDATQLFNPLVAGVIEQAKVLYLQQDPGLSKDLNEIATKMRTELEPRLSEVKNQVAMFYATAFTEQELKDMVTFYKSPAGQKMLKVQPDVVDNSMKFAQNWANKLSDEVVAKMRAELKKKGHAM